MRKPIVAEFVSSEGVMQSLLVLATVMCSPVADFLVDFATVVIPT